MNALMTFLAMGGYGGYVWSAFAITTIVLAANLIYALRQKQKALKGRPAHSTGQARKRATP